MVYSTTTTTTTNTSTYHVILLLLLLRGASKHAERLTHVMVTHNTNTHRAPKLEINHTHAVPTHTPLQTQHIHIIHTTHTRTRSIHTRNTNTPHTIFLHYTRNTYIHTFVRRRTLIRSKARAVRYAHHGKLHNTALARHILDTQHRHTTHTATHTTLSEHLNASPTGQSIILRIEHLCERST